MALLVTQKRVRVLGQNLAPIDDNRLARHELGLVRGEVDHCVADVVSVTQVARRYDLGDFFDALLTVELIQAFG